LLSTRIEVQEQVLETVSLDIHDNIGQVLSLGCIQLANLKNTTPEADMAGKLEDILQLFKQSVKDLRLLSHSLNTGLIGQKGLEQSIQTQFSRIEAFSNIECTLTSGNIEEALTPEQRLIIFRITQEALQNILKHAEATKIDILLHQDDYHFMVRIQDNGVGFEMDKNKDEPGGSLGLVGMQQRAAFLHANLSIHSLIGKGTEITLKIPIN